MLLFVTVMNNLVTPRETQLPIFVAFALVAELDVVVIFWLIWIYSWLCYIHSFRGPVWGSVSNVTLIFSWNMLILTLSLKYSGRWFMNVQVDVIINFSYMNGKVHFSLSTSGTCSFFFSLVLRQFSSFFFIKIPGFSFKTNKDSKKITYWNDNIFKP